MLRTTEVTLKFMKWDFKFEKISFKINIWQVSYENKLCKKFVNEQDFSIYIDFYTG